MASTDLTRTHTVATADERKKHTFSAWIKLSSIGSDSSNVFFANRPSNTYRFYYMIMHSGGGGNTVPNAFYTYMVYNGSEMLEASGTKKLRDVNGWYHIVVRTDTTQATAADRFRVYINGEQDSVTLHHAPDQNEELQVNRDTTHYIGEEGNGNGQFNGSMSHIHFCDGYSYAPTEFGETDSTTGEWKIKTSPSVSYGTNGFFILKDGNSVTDQSGNSHNWAVNAGTLTKTEDNPSNVFCVLNGITSKSKPTLSLGNLKTGSSSDGHYVFGTQASKTGYYEIKLGQNPDGSSGSGLTFGTFDSNSSDNDLNSTNIRMYKTNHAYSASYSIDVGNGAGTNTGVSAAAGDIINVAWKNGKLYCGKNGTYFFSANPSNNTDGSTQVTLNDSSAYQLPISKSNVSGMTNSEWNFGNGYFGTTAITSNSGNGYQDANGQGKFQYQPPTGCYALCTKNLNV